MHICEWKVYNMVNRLHYYINNYYYTIIYNFTIFRHHMDSCFYSFYKVPIIVINLNPQRYVREVKYSLLPVKSSLCLNCLNLKQLKTSNFNVYKKKKCI